MTSPIPGVSLAGFTGVSAIGGATSTPAASSTSGSDFAGILATSLDQLQSTQSKADNLATQAATGDLNDVHDYMIASAEARLSTDTVVTLKNSAVAAFTEIMRMNV
jgi:flagellar hook-basal body complex protein FliE